MYVLHFQFDYFGVNFGLFLIQFLPNTFLLFQFGHFGDICFFVMYAFSFYNFGHFGVNFGLYFFFNQFLS